MNLNDISKSLIVSNSECSVELRNKLLKVGLSLMQSPTQNRSRILEKLSSDYNISKAKITEILGMYLALIRLFIESSSDKEFNNRLLELGFANDFVDNLPLSGNRTKIVEMIVNARRGEVNKLVSLKWRIDVSLCNSALVKKIPPSVILCLQFKDGRKYTINVNIRTFHNLRFNVALLMREQHKQKNISIE